MAAPKKDPVKEFFAGGFGGSCLVLVRFKSFIAFYFQIKNSFKKFSRLAIR